MRESCGLKLDLTEGADKFGAGDMFGFWWH